MAKTQTQGALSPFAFATGAPIYADDAKAVAEALNWAFGYTPHTHVSLNVGDSRPWDGQAIVTHNVIVPATGTEQVYVGRIWIDDDVVSITVAAELAFPALSPDTVDVDFVIGADSTTISFDLSDTDAEQTSSLLTADTGTGWQDFSITLTKTSGTADNIPVLAIRIEDEAITSSLPSPVSE